MPSRARRERQKQRSIQRKKRLQVSEDLQQHQQQAQQAQNLPFMSSSAIPTGYHDHHRQSWQPHSHSHSHSQSHSHSFGSAAAAAAGAMPSSIPGSHQSLFHNPSVLTPHPESLDWSPAYDSFLVLDVEATCMDIPRGTSFHHGPPPAAPPTPLQNSIPLLSSSSSSSSTSTSSHHPQHQQRLSVSHASPGPSSYLQHSLMPGSYTSSGGTAMGTPTSVHNGLASPGLFPVPNSPLLSPMSSNSPLPSSSPSPSHSFGRTALVDYPNEIIEFPVILMQWRDVPPEQGGRPGQRTLEVVDEFHSWVRPAWRPRLSRFCKELTGVRQNVIDSAPSWPEVMQNFLEFLRKHNLLADNQPPRGRSSSIASSSASGSSPLPFGAFSPASPPIFPMLSSPSPSSHHLPHLHHPHHHGNFHFPQQGQGQQAQQQQQQQPQQSQAHQRQLSPGPNVEWESLLMTTPLRRGVAWCTHGPYDLRDFVLKSCFLSGLRTPPSPPYWLRGPLIDIRKCAAEILLEERMLRLRTGDAKEFAAKECRKAQLARAMMGEPPLLSRKGKGKDGSRATAGNEPKEKDSGDGSTATTAAAEQEDDQEWKRELELDHLLQSYERSMRAWPWYSAAISGQSGRFSSGSAGHAVAHAERVKILPDGTIDGILYSLGLGLFTGRKHSGLDDSRNLARIFGDMARRVGEVAAGRGTPGWESGRTDVGGTVKKRKAGRRRRRRVGDEVHGLEDGVAGLELGSSSSDDVDGEDDEDDEDSLEDESGSSGEFDDDDEEDDDDDEEDEEDVEELEEEGGWIGADPGGRSGSAGHSFVSTYNDRERRRLCALQGQVFERACLLPNSFWKPLYLPTTVFSPVAATAARLLIWGTGPENRGSHHHHHHGASNGRGGGGGGHRNSSHSNANAMENSGPPVPARPIWMEGRRHAWMGPNPGQVFWNGPAIVDDYDDGHEVDDDDEEEEEEAAVGGQGTSNGRAVGGSDAKAEGADSDDEDDDEVFRYPGVSPDNLDRTVSDLRKIGNGERRGSGTATAAAAGGKVLGTPKGEDESDVFTYTSSSSSSSSVSAPVVDEANLLDDVDIGNSSYSRSSSVSRSSRSSSSSPTRSRRGLRSSLDDDRADDDHGDGHVSRAIPIPIPIPGAGGGGLSTGTVSSGPASTNGPATGSTRGARGSHDRRGEGHIGGMQTPTRTVDSRTSGGGGGGRTPNGQRTPVLGSSSSTSAATRRV
ncbi:hypothetical protein A4X13_0g4405 [Tilletia indica]|uniref:Exonuclease domain-containing protein n=1 Tax=Tilletia indica TaxID=43049 RepID=A0A177TQR4_9BASI|nr:hypothetical protein A4X13_0g4405 [Tilletia indica]